MTRLLLVRHGESLWNAENRLQGHGGTGLSPLGHAQAQATAEHLAKTYREVSLIVRSDLPRVAETAAPTEALVDAEVRLDERLREIDVGFWSGLTWDEVAVRDPEGLRRWRAGEDVARGGGETWAQLRARVWPALNDLHDVGGLVLVFTHGGPIRIGVAAALDLPLFGEERLAPVANCSLTEIGFDGDRVRLHSYNRSGHLALYPQ